MTNDQFLKMSTKEYDEYMCETYPIMFRERNLSCMETCMCWGFDIGAGWRELADKTCNKITFFENDYHITAIFKQVKQKNGGLRLYHNPTLLLAEPSYPESALKKIYSIIDNITDIAEHKSYHMCEDCSKFVSKPIVCQNWIYTLCDECFTKNIMDRKLESDPKIIIAEALAFRDALEQLNWYTHSLTLEQLHTINKQILTMRQPHEKSNV